MGPAPLGKKRVSSLSSHERLHHDTPSNIVEGYPIMFFSSLSAALLCSSFNFSAFRIPSRRMVCFML